MPQWILGSLEAGTVSYEPRGAPVWPHERTEAVSSAQPHLEALKEWCRATFDQSTSEQILQAVAKILIGELQTTKATLGVEMSPLRGASYVLDSRAGEIVEVATVGGLLPSLLAGEVRFEEVRAVLPEDLLDEFGF